jgi:hypothetical protein
VPFSDVPMKRNITHKSRGRSLTPEEAAKYRAIREQIELEKPENDAQIRAKLNEMGIDREKDREQRDEYRILVSNPQFEADYEIWGAAPVQAIGTAFGRDIYFRARHNEWTFEIADETGNLPSDGQDGPSSFIIRGKDPNASYMPLQDAQRIVEHGLREFANRKQSPNSGPQK